MRLFADGLALIERAGGPDGGVFASTATLPYRRPDILGRFHAWVSAQPDRVLLTEPTPSGRRSITYAEADAGSAALHGLLVERHGLRHGDRLGSLLPAGIDGLVLKLACLRGGLVHVALPPFPFRDGARNEANAWLLEVSRPSLLLAPGDHPAIPGLAAEPPPALSPGARRGVPETEPHDPADWAAIFFTSGSTGRPKGVPIMRGMISSCQAAYAVMWPFLAATPPVLVDWLPWHHVFGGLDNVFKIVWNGGTLHVDALPGPVTMGESVRLLAEAGPTMHIAVPRGLKALLDRLETDPAAAAGFTRRLQAIFFAGAGIEEALWRRLLAFRDRHATFEILSGYGATEAGSTICLSPGPLERPGELGVPLAGHEVRLVQGDGASELRVRGPNVAPGYLTEAGLAPLPLDEHGFYRTGDAAVLRRRADGRLVLAFDGRLAEDFKLSSGVKVRVGIVRAGLLATFGELADDVVIAGEDREQLVALVFPAAGAPTGDALLTGLAAGIDAWNRANPASSTAIHRFAVAAEPPDRSLGEVSDKGQVVQRVYRRNHADRFERLLLGEGAPPGRPRPLP